MRNRALAARENRAAVVRKTRCSLVGQVARKSGCADVKATGIAFDRAAHRRGRVAREFAVVDEDEGWRRAALAPQRAADIAGLIRVEHASIDRELATVGLDGATVRSSVAGERRSLDVHGAAGITPNSAAIEAAVGRKGAVADVKRIAREIRDGTAVAAAHAIGTKAGIYDLRSAIIADHRTIAAGERVSTKRAVEKRRAAFDIDYARTGAVAFHRYGVERQRAEALDRMTWAAVACLAAMLQGQPLQRQAAASENLPEGIGITAIEDHVAGAVDDHRNVVADKIRRQIASERNGAAARECDRAAGRSVRSRQCRLKMTLVAGGYDCVSCPCACASDG